MFETPITVVGNIITDPVRRSVGEQEVIKFRVASNSRRRGPDGTWEAGNSLYITVNCWGKLVTGVGAALGKGAPVIAVGTVHTSDYEDRDGNPRSSLEMRATSVGPDLSRTIVRIEKSGYTGADAAQGADEAPPADSPDGGVSGDSDTPADTPAEPVGSDGGGSRVSRKAPALSPQR